MPHQTTKVYEITLPPIITHVSPNDRTKANKIRQAKIYKNLLHNLPDQEIIFDLYFPPFRLINEPTTQNAFRYDTLVKNDFEHILATEEKE